MSEASDEAALVELCLGSREPATSLVNDGELPAGWTEEYLRLLGRVGTTWLGRDSLPRDAVAAIHFASWYLEVRYRAWRNLGPGRRNTTTEDQLAAIRQQSELALMGETILRWIASRQAPPIA